MTAPDMSVHSRGQLSQLIAHPQVNRINCFDFGCSFSYIYFLIITQCLIGLISPFIYTGLTEVLRELNGYAPVDHWHPCGIYNEVLQKDRLG